MFFSNENFFQVFIPFGYINMATAAGANTTAIMFYLNMVMQQNIQ